MQFSFNVDNLINAVYNLLIADSTLRGSNYLNGKKIFKSKSPKGIENRYIVVECQPLIPDSSMYYVGEIRIHVYVELLSNGLIDTSGNRILSRCEELLNNQIPSLTSGSIQPLYSLGTVPMYYQEGMGSKAKGVLRLRAELKIAD